MKKKIILTIAFVINLLPMLLNQYGEMSLQNSINFAFSEFYIGLAISLIMVVAYFVIDKFVKE